MTCKLCPAPSQKTAIDPDCDLKFPICDGCIESKGYTLCALCDFYYNDKFLGKENNEPTCVYCVGERDFPFYEDVDQ